MSNSIVEISQKTLAVLIASFLICVLGFAVLHGQAFAAQSSENDYAPTAQDIKLAKSDPAKENSYRYSNGKQIKKSVASPSQGKTSLQKVVVKGGYKYFDTFDTFKQGYCSGVGAYKGIDVSEHQSTINWSKVKSAGVDFAIIRCGYGSNVESQDDKFWLENVKGCLQNNIPFGVYLYSYADTAAKAKSEANHTLRCLNAAGLSPNELSYPVYFDMEDQVTFGSNYAQLAKTYCTTLQNAGYSAGVYSSTYWWNNYLTSSVFSNYAKWVAEFNATIGLTYAGLSNISSGNGIWQFSCMGRINGITANTVDLNYTYMPPKFVDVMRDAYKIPSTPYSRTVKDGEYIIYSHAATTMTATVLNGSKAADANIHLGKSDMTAKQRFIFTRDATTGFYTITNSRSGKVMGLAKSGPIYLTNLAQRTQKSSDNSQRWIVTKSAANQYVIKNAANPNYVMKLANAKAANGSNIQVGKWKGTKSQKWGLASVNVNVPRSSAKIKTGIYTLALSKNTARAIEVKGGSAAKGANIQLNVMDKSAKQKFLIQNDGDGYYHILSAISKKAVVPALGNLVPKTNVHLAKYSKNSIKQKWSVSKSGSRYVFKSAANGHVLEVAAGSSKKKANVQTNHKGATTSQKFVLKKIKASRTVKAGVHGIALSTNAKKGVAVKGNSKKAGKRMVLGLVSKSKSSKFVFTYERSTGYYTIKNKNSGLFLEVAGKFCSPGKAVKQVKKSDSYAQRWIIAKVSKNRYIIKSALNPEYVIDGGTSKAKLKNGIKVYKRNKARSQIWSL